jgi:hypothetical protein
MSDIFKQWQQAKQEFGEEAYQRFNDTGTWSCNDDVEYELSWNPDGVELKPSHELFEHGVNVYGIEQEVKMWEWRNDNGEWRDVPEFARHNAVFCNMSVHQHRRKQSAALPFDIERARAGDDLLFLKNGEWLDCTLESIGLKFFAVLGNDFEGGGNVDDIPQILRMKYPPKVTK